ncbi:MAG: hypothetical protein ACYTG1_07705 [Planctomycetota bacterium]|jgi:hypothetical protein
MHTDRDTATGSAASPVPLTYHGERDDVLPTRERSGPDLDADLAGEVLDTIETMSRRIEDLARELNCLGYFDEDDDRPRAA